MAKSVRKTKTPTKRRQSNRTPFILAGLMLLLSGAVAFWVFNRDEPGFIRYDAFGIEMPAQYDIHGIDVSKYQQRINWTEMKNMQVGDIQLGFAFIKATEGTRLTDRQFDRNWSEAKKVGITRGAYHFFLPQRDGKEQAEHFIDQVELESGDMPPVLDVEQRYGVPIETIRKRVRDFLTTLEDHYRVKPILYTNVSFYQHVLGSEFDDYPLWVAHYLQKDKPRIARPWLLWQHSESGRVNGIKGSVDFNVFNGDSSDWRRFLIR